MSVNYQGLFQWKCDLNVNIVLVPNIELIISKYLITSYEFDLGNFLILRNGFIRVSFIIYYIGRNGNTQIVRFAFSRKEVKSVTGS